MLGEINYYWLWEKKRGFVLFGERGWSVKFFKGSPPSRPWLTWGPAIFPSFSWRVVPGGESPMEVMLVSCFGFFCFCFVLDFDAELAWEQITRS